MAIEDDPAGAVVLGEVTGLAPPHEMVPIGEDLHVPESTGGHRGVMDQLLDQRYAAAVLVEGQNEAARLGCFVGGTTLGVENGEDPAPVQAHVVLERPVNARAAMELVALASRLPQDLTRGPVNLVERPNVAAGNDEVAVSGVDGDGVDVEVVPRH